MIFNRRLPGGDMPSLGINFSRPGAQVLLQYGTRCCKNSAGTATEQCIRSAVKWPHAQPRHQPDARVHIVDGWQRRRRYSPGVWQMTSTAAGPCRCSRAAATTAGRFPAYPMPDSITDVESCGSWWQRLDRGLGVTSCWPIFAPPSQTCPTTSRRQPAELLPSLSTADHTHAGGQRGRNRRGVGAP